MMEPATAVLDRSVALPGARTAVGPRAAARRTHWVNTVAHLDPKYGGLSSAVPALSAAVAAAGDHALTIASFCRPDEHYRPDAGPAVEVEHFPLGRVGWWKARLARAAFRQMVADAAGVHIHGLWQASTATAAHFARRESKPYVVSAHGMLETWAVNNKRWKKTLYAALVERRVLAGAACLHALTAAEAQDYRRFGLNNPIAVIPNGVNVPAELRPDAFLARFPALAGKRLVLFLGRLHFKKGLDLLAEAWAAVSTKYPAAQLVLAGPDFENTQCAVERRLEALGIRERVTFTGMLGGDLKWSALSAAECFVLPSYSEGLSVSVLEAMGAGLPVIVTEQCNLPAVRTHDCGWTIQPRVDELRTALEELLSGTASDRRQHGENGRRLVGERYSWPVIGSQMSALYRWVAGGPRPADVELDWGAQA